MNSYVFCSGQLPTEEELSSSSFFDDRESDIFQVTLHNDQELYTLLKLLSIDSVQEVSMARCLYFDKLFNYSSQKLPLLDQSDFDLFYDRWLEETGRESSMDEYGQLIFVMGCAAQWNESTHRFVIREC